MTVINEDARIQYTATGGQTAFTFPFEIMTTADILVYQLADGGTPNDATDILTLGVDYTVTLNTPSVLPSSGTVTLLVGATVDDTVTLQGNAPAERDTSFTVNGVIQAANLNEEFDNDVLIYQTILATLDKLTPKYPKSAIVNSYDVILPLLTANTTWVMDDAGTEIIAAAFPSAGAAALNLTYLTLTDETAELPNSVDLSAAGNGLMVNSAGVGILARTLTGVTNQTVITNATGVAGHPIIGIASNPIMPGTAGMGIPSGTTAQRVIPVSNIGLRYNTDTNELEYYNGGWIQLEGSTGVYLPLAGGTMSGNIDMATHDILNGGLVEATTLDVGGTIVIDAIIDDDSMATATDTNVPTSESVVAYIASELGAYLALAGGTMAGNIDMDGNDVLDIGIASFQNGLFSQSFTSGVLAGNLNYTLPTGYPSVTGYILSSTDAGVMSWVPNTAGSMVSVVGTANEIEVNPADPQNPILLLPAVLNIPGTFNIQSTTAVDEILDEDTMVSDSATALATQQSIKAYVDTEVADLNASLAQPNIIIGGNFDTNPWQRGTSFTGLTGATNSYTADRWSYTRNGAGVVSITKATDAPTKAQAGIFSQYCLFADVTTADASLSGTDQYFLRYVVEGYDYNAIAQKECTLSFWAKSSQSGIHCFAMSNYGGDERYVTEYTINAADTWEYKTITFTTPASGTWQYTNLGGLYMYWTLACASGYEGTADQWTNTTLLLGTGNQVNLLANIGDYLKIQFVNLRPGSVATPYPVENEEQVLAKCQRYYYRITGVVFHGVGWYNSTSSLVAYVPFNTAMRSNPTVEIGAASEFTVTFGTSTNVCTAYALSTANVNGCTVLATGTGTPFTAGQAGGVRGNVAGAYVGFTAEL